MPRLPALLLSAALAVPAHAGPSGEVETVLAETPEGALAHRAFGPEDGPPLVLIQRFRGTMDDWDPAFRDALAATRRVVMFDGAGVGASEGEPADDVAGMAAEAAAVIEALGKGPVDVLGWSMGGFTAQALAAARPDLVRRLVLVGTGPAAGPGTPPPSEGVFEVATRESYGEEERTYLFFADHPEALARAEASMARIDAARRGPPTGPEVMAAQSTAIEEWWFDPSAGYGERLPGIEAPALIVAGDRDPFFSPEGQAALLAALPEARLAIHPMAGHAPHHQHPEAVAAQIEAFLAEPDAEPEG